MIKLSTDKLTLQAYLQEKGWLAHNETIHTVEKPGEGNMNFTLRVDTGERTFIVKQSRGYVEKYPQVAAPAERALREAEFYELVSEYPALRAMMPTIVGLDAENSVLVMDDLGAGADYTFVYRTGETMPEADLLEIMDFAARLHTSITTETTEQRIPNRAMRALNHEHIFHYPYLEDNGLNLDHILPSLQAAALPYKQDEQLKARVRELGELYLADGKTLLHGDYFPGSWLKTPAGVRIIDPEFCFFGPPEFEIGVTMAHLKMADQSETLIDKARERYLAQATLDEALCRQFTAIEILRRIMGLAQLPLEIDLEKRKELLAWSRSELLG